MFGAGSWPLFTRLSAIPQTESLIKETPPYGKPDAGQNGRHPGADAEERDDKPGHDKFRKEKCKAKKEPQKFVIKIFKHRTSSGIIR